MEKHFRELVNIVKKLRAPDGCPWDRQQTLYSLKEYLIEEVFELVDAIDKKDIDNIKEELGDLLLHVILHSTIAEEENLFTLNDVIKSISEKLIRRHPHVFGDTKVESSDDVMVNWEKIKKEEKKNRSILDEIPNGLPSIQKALKLQERARKVGFDWDSADDCLQKVNEEFKEFIDAVSSNNKDEISHELGDLFFALINFSRFIKINPDESLRKTNERFLKRFNYIEKKLHENHLTFDDVTLDELDKYWCEAKKIVG
ncbi:nucleoside triphosphate pyrophosphohydrolase [Calditerrivibrio nitroreducens]|uniref:Nucleoside triphosphate pyrophosphohydrolase n=1 Tax=Calditerrivibrio nitroreducens (strain DSM 19672 / NBRC 101217 / Yu37-1) TaxID=768670 RepID=E4TH35_CALNY|nr:nucleoside triphosphate pyrophosphohydrolase [Calditerrivibrio nitroreducens]ADR19833.1 MazG family protein [Calditerrivibrio nitroreducens DSM 19672]